MSASDRDAARRYLDGSKWSEALAAAATIHVHARCPRPCAARMALDSIRWRDFTRMTREDRAADYAGQPSVPQRCPILHLATTGCHFYPHTR